MASRLDSVTTSDSSLLCLAGPLANTSALRARSMSFSSNTCDAQKATPRGVAFCVFCSLVDQRLNEPVQPWMSTIG